MDERDYVVGNEAKLEYGSTKGTYNKRFYGWLSIPEIGGEPNDIDTTTKDNVEYETSQPGLKPAVKFNIEFNMENPNTEANINITHNLAQSKAVQYFKITRNSGITHEFSSKVLYSYNECGVNEIDKFTMYLRPREEVETIVPSGTPSI